MVMKAGFDIVQNRKLLEQADVLEGSCNPGPVDVNGALSRNVGIIQHDLSGIRLVHAGQKVEYGCLSGAVGADQTVELSFLDGDAEIIYRFQAAEGNAQIFHSKHSHINSPPSLHVFRSAPSAVRAGQSPSVRRSQSSSRSGRWRRSASGNCSVPGEAPAEGSEPRPQ